MMTRAMRNEVLNLLKPAPRTNQDLCVGTLAYIALNGDDVRRCVENILRQKRYGNKVDCITTLHKEGCEVKVYVEVIEEYTPARTLVARGAILGHREVVIDEEYNLLFEFDIWAEDAEGDMYKIGNADWVQRKIQQQTECNWNYGGSI